MARSYHRLTFAERTLAEELYKNGATVIEIAESVGVSVPTMYRDLKRGRNPQTGLYEAERAQKALFA